MFYIALRLLLSVQNAIVTFDYGFNITTLIRMPPPLKGTYMRPSFSLRFYRTKSLFIHMF